jgi:PiT family inorganic phosphate transporter
VDVIITYGIVFMGLAIAFGLYMTWGIGANDVANAMGTSVGSGAITVKQAILIAAVFEFAGVMLAGGHVTSTIRKGVVDPTPIVDSPELLVFGMLASLLAAAIWLMIASWKGWPVSTTHSIVGALVGFAVVGIGKDAVQWDKVWQIVASWVVSPLLGGLLAFALMRSIRRLILDTDEPFHSRIPYRTGDAVQRPEAPQHRPVRACQLRRRSGRRSHHWFSRLAHDPKTRDRSGGGPEVPLLQCRKGIRPATGIYSLRHGFRTRV